MNLAKTYCLVGLILFAASCSNDETQLSSQAQVVSPSFDTSRIAILPFNDDNGWMFTQKNLKPAELSSGEIEKIEVLLAKCMKEYNNKQEDEFDMIKAQNPKFSNDKKWYLIDYANYKRQYVSVIDEKGQKLVWVNCFCDAWDTNWKKDLLVVDDGGKCFFNLKINLSSENYFDLIVNGVA